MIRKALLLLALLVVCGEADAAGPGRLRMGSSGGVPGAPASVLDRLWGQSVWNLQLAATATPAGTGPRYVPTKNLENTALPPGATVSAPSSNRTLTLGTCPTAPTPCVFEGWAPTTLTSTSVKVDVEAPYWILQDNLIGPNPGSPTYDLQINAENVVVRYNTSTGGYNGMTEVGFSVKSGATGSNIEITRNRLIGYTNDPVKLNGTDVTSTRTWYHENYEQVGGWHEYPCGVVGHPDCPHDDLVTIQAGGALIERNFFDAISYISVLQYPGGITAPIPVNTPPVEAPANFYTQMTNGLRVAPTSNNTTIDNVTYRENILRGHRRGGFYPFEITAAGSITGTVWGTFSYTDNVIEPGIYGGVFNLNGTPPLPVPTPGVMIFTGNSRYSDGAVFTGANAVQGATGGVPNAPVFTGFGTVGQTTLQLVFDTAQDAVSQLVSYSVLGPDAGFTTYAALPLNHVLTVPTPGIAYWVKLRGRNAIGDGPESAVLSTTTSP